MRSFYSQTQYSNSMAIACSSCDNSSSSAAPQTTTMIMMMIFSIVKLTLNLRANLCFQVKMMMYNFPPWHLLMWHLNDPGMLANQLNGNLQERQPKFRRKLYDWTQRLILTVVSLNILCRECFRIFSSPRIFEKTLFFKPSCATIEKV